MNSQPNPPIDLSHAKEPPKSLNLDAPEPARSEESEPVGEQERENAIDRQMTSAFIPGGAVTSSGAIEQNP